MAVLGGVGCGLLPQALLLLSCKVVRLTVQRLLRSYEGALEAGQKELLEREVIFGDDLERILKAHPPVEIIGGSNGSNGASANGSNGAAAERVPVGAEGSAR